MKYPSLFLLFVLFSCANKEDVLLPKAASTIVSNVEDHSSIYIFFRTNGKDTLAEVNRKNSIISTNWILNIDKRLPLKLVIPEVMKLQEKKRKEVAHKNEKAENYYSYADSIGENLAFLPFTKVYYKMEKAHNDGLKIYFKKRNNDVLVNSISIKKNEVVQYIYNIDYIFQPKILLIFDKEMSYDEYIQSKILIRKLDSFNNKVPEEFIY